MPASSHILHTDAVVLRAIDYSESSRIVTLFTRDSGKMGVIAKGARSGKHRFGSTLEPMAHINAVIYCKSGRDLQNLTETTHIQTHESLRHSLERIEAGLRIVEFTNSVMEVDQEQQDVFALLVGTLAALENAPARIGNVWLFFQLRMAFILGFGPAFDRDVVNNMQVDAGFLDLKNGEIGERPEEGQAPVRATRAALRAFAVLSRAQLGDIMRMELTTTQMGEVSNLVTAYLKYHIEDAYPSRAAKVFDQLDAPS